MFDERKLASIQKILEISSHDNADSLELATILGWQCVVKKGEFEEGELVLWFEIDSWVPHDVAPFLTRDGKEPRVYKDVPGERLRTVKLRGQLSQGLILPLNVLDDAAELVAFYGREGVVGKDVTEELGVLKWEPQIPAQLQGIMRGSFPPFIPKTDAERIQNIPEVAEDCETEYEVSLKLDGSSITMYAKDGDCGICSRNISLKMETENEDNTYVRTAYSSGYFGSLMTWHGFNNYRNIALQGELMGPGIQGNREKLDSHQIFIFNIYDIDAQRYLGHHERMTLLEELGMHIQVAPVFKTGQTLEQMGLHTVKDVLAAADNARSLNNPIAEGLVFKSMDGATTFKAISNKFLLKSE